MVAVELTPEHDDSHESPFKQAADRLIAAGYTPIPILPRDKAPGDYRGSTASGSWTLMEGWNNYATTKPSDASIARWKTWPDANIGITLGTRVGGYVLVAIDFDTDDQNELDLLQSCIPHSRMTKRGRRGYTAFYRASPSTRTKRYTVADKAAIEPNKKRCVIEILTGNQPRQTIMPPSVHPSGMVYAYMTGDEIVPIGELPVLSDDHFERLEDTLEHLGWNPPPVANNDNVVGDDSNIWRETNNAALANFGVWVEGLGLPNARQRLNGYEATAPWRASNEGRPLELRKPNLKFHTTGIKDMGTDEGFTALDVVMAAKELTASDALVWLRAKLGFDDSTDGFPDDLPERPLPGTRKDVPPEARAAAIRKTRSPWERHGEPSPYPPAAWLIRLFLDSSGLAVLAGESGAGKTFAAIGLAVAAASGTPFLGMPMRRRTGVAFILGEGRSTMAHRLAAATSAIPGLSDVDKLPISYISTMLATEGDRQNVTAMLREESRRMKEAHNVGIGIVIIDTLAACMGFKDENSAAETTAAMVALTKLGESVGALVVAVAHHGKTEGTGIRGSSALTASADTILTVLCEKDSAGRVEQRSLVLTKTRNAEPGKRIVFSLNSTEVGIDDEGEPIVSAYVEVSDEAPIVRVRRERLSPAAQCYMQALDAVFDRAIEIRPFGNDGPAVKAVDREHIRSEFYVSYAADDGDAKRRSFNNAGNKLVQDRKIATRAVGVNTTYVWKL